MFDEKRQEQLEKQVLNLASQVQLALNHEKAMQARHWMMAILRDLHDNFNSVKLCGNKQVVDAIKFGFDDRYKKMLMNLHGICGELIQTINEGRKPDLRKMYELDDRIHDLKNWRI